MTTPFVVSHEDTDSSFDEVSLTDSLTDISSVVGPVVDLSSSSSSSPSFSPGVPSKRQSTEMVKAVVSALGREEYKARKMQKKREKRKAEKLQLLRRAMRLERKELFHQFGGGIGHVIDVGEVKRVLEYIMNIDPPYFCSGIPVTTFTLFSFLIHWDILKEEDEGEKEGEVEPSNDNNNEEEGYIKEGKEKALWLIVETFYDKVKQAIREGRRLVYWFSNLSALLHLVSCKTKQLPKVEEKEKEKQFEGSNTVLVAASSGFKIGLESGLSEEAFITAEFDTTKGACSLHGFTRELESLLTKIFLVLLRRVRPSLEEAGLAAFIDGKGIEELTSTLNGCIMDFIENFAGVPLAQQFFEALFQFLSTAIFNTVITSQKLSPDDAINMKMNLVYLENWLIDTGGVWAEKCAVHLQPISQLIQVLFVRKKSLLQEAVRKEVAPALNDNQIKKALLARTVESDKEDFLDDRDLATIVDLPDEPVEKPIPVIHLDLQKLHYIEPVDVESVLFPAKLKDALIALHQEISGAEESTKEDQDNHNTHNNNKNNTGTPTTTTTPTTESLPQPGFVRSKLRMTSFLSGLGSSTSGPQTARPSSGSNSTAENSRRPRTARSTFKLSLFPRAAVQTESQ